MRPANRARWLALAVSLLGQAACSSSDTDCTCAVQNNGERRTLVCGQSVCVGGTTVLCEQKEQTVQRGVCTAPPASSEPDPGSSTEPPNPGSDRSCDDLVTFCNTSCGGPASASADCQATASSGDPAACAAWPTASGALCHP